MNFGYRLSKLTLVILDKFKTIPFQVFLIKIKNYKILKKIK
jgi:hypothetical protein